MCLACEGAPTNLTVLKTTLGVTGAFTYIADSRLNTSFVNSLDMKLKSYRIICPQLKNMVSALHSSRLNGTKHFVCSYVHFGWLNNIAKKKKTSIVKKTVAVCSSSTLELSRTR